MEPLLFLAHRIPFPPNKGDKITNFEMLRYFARHYEVHLGTFVDDPQDFKYVPKVLEYCATAHFEPLNPTVSKLLSARALLGSRPLTLAYYPTRNLRSWCAREVAGNRIQSAFISSTPMFQFVRGIEGLRRRVVHFHDLDSDKWRQYAESRRWPLSAVFRREARTLLQEERSIAHEADAGFFVTPAEATLFRSLAPESAAKIHWPGHGLDYDYYRPDESLPSPYRSGERAILFVGVMDYWPNEDAATWFSRDVLPGIRARHPEARFYVVGLNPPASVRALDRDAGVVVTGAVPDVRPYLQHAAVVVAPLRIARGIQNKALQGMAMCKPVVMTSLCAGSLSARAGIEIEVADSGEEFASRVSYLLSHGERAARMGELARERVLRDYSWEESMARMNAFLAAPDSTAAVPDAAPVRVRSGTGGATTSPAEQVLRIET
jgi:sugar transferase (PEP-CTERM/EpsH1 system associated)